MTYNMMVTLKKNTLGSYEIVASTGVLLFEFQAKTAYEAVETAKVYMSSWTSVSLEVDPSVNAK